MIINLTFAELHTPLFLNGKNWGVKLDVAAAHRGKIELHYDRAEKELHVKAGPKLAIIPLSNVVSMTPAPEGLDSLESISKMEFVPKPKPGTPGKIKAQASTPMDHVFNGIGAGKTHDAK